MCRADLWNNNYTMIILAHYTDEHSNNPTCVTMKVLPHISVCFLFLWNSISSWMIICWGVGVVDGTSAYGCLVPKTLLFMIFSPRSYQCFTKYYNLLPFFFSHLTIFWGFFWWLNKWELISHTESLINNMIPVNSQSPKAELFFFWIIHDVWLPSSIA